jgi:hypothetical protein
LFPFRSAGREKNLETRADWYFARHIRQIAGSRYGSAPNHEPFLLFVKGGLNPAEFPVEQILRGAPQLDQAPVPCENLRVRIAPAFFPIEL